MATKDNSTISGTNGAGTTTTTSLPAEEKVEGETLTFDGWLDQQPENVKNLLDVHTKGLKSALESERGSRKDLEKQLRDLAKKVEAGSETEKQLTELADQQASASRRADFYESAHREGVTNLKLAFTVAGQDELFDKKGNVDFGEMKKFYPELFGTVAGANANAGSGTGKPPAATFSMDNYIREKVNKK